MFAPQATQQKSFLTLEKLKWDPKTFEQPKGREEQVPRREPDTDHLYADFHSAQIAQRDPAISISVPPKTRSLKFSKNLYCGNFSSAGLVVS